MVEQSSFGTALHSLGGHSAEERGGNLGGTFFLGTKRVVEFVAAVASVVASLEALATEDEPLLLLLLLLIRSEIDIPRF